MMTTRIPRSCIKEIHKLQMRFIWGDTKYKRKFHDFKLNTVTRPKDEGGLGLMNLETMNNACLSKLGRKLHHEGEDLWCSVVWGKYGRDSSSDDSSL
ncbi:unnamed protein product [Lathyrus oleraceus]